MTPDLFNALFEAIGALFLLADCRALHRDKQLRGVYWPGRVFFATWGLWNVLYYPAIGQTLSFIAGVAVLVANAIWCSLAWLYTRPSPAPDSGEALGRLVRAIQKENTR